MAKDGPLHGSGWALSSREPQNNDEKVQSMQTAASRSFWSGQHNWAACKGRQALEFSSCDWVPHEAEGPTSGPL